MALSAELTRFLADHATAESRAAFASGVDGAPAAANLAADMRAKGYQVGDAELATALEASRQSGLGDRELDAVVGGQGANPQGNPQAINNNLQVDMSMIANVLDRMNTMFAQIARTGG